MDLPIKIVVTLFVALVVGGSIILFAQRTLTRSELNLASITKDDKTGVQIVTLTPSATSDDLRKLADACARMTLGGVDNADCFVIRGPIPSTAGLNGIKVTNNMTVQVSVVGTPSALFIGYDPRGFITITS